MQSWDKIFITPDLSLWDPYSKHFSQNEELMLDSDGQIVEATPKFKPLIVDDDIDYFGYDESVEACMVEAWIDSVISD
eukprot:1235202-Ditylum_brightwellii.AAC.1